MTKSQIAEGSFVDTHIRAHVKYSHVQEGDQWLITCPSCTGNGFDVESVGFSICLSCEGAGESSPAGEHEVKAFFNGSIPLPV